MTSLIKPQSGFLFYQTEDGQTRVEVRLEGRTVWLTQKMLAELYQVAVPTINEHIKNIYEDNELGQEATIRKFRIVQMEGAREVMRLVEHYNLEAILAVGYRVRSHRGVQFRRWATARLQEFVVKGFTLDDERLKQGGAKNEYFDELLERIREIRASEKNFYRKVCDIYRTSIDYDPRAEMTEAFFQTVQNKMHWATHGHTAAEVIHQRSDAEMPYMEMTSWSGAKIRKKDIAVAKNYLTEAEIKKLNLIVSMYLDYAELQALERCPMHMRDWIEKLDEFLRASRQNILENAGTVSADEARKKAEQEFERYQEKQRLIESTVSDAELLRKFKEIEKGAKPSQGPSRGKNK